MPFEEAVEMSQAIMSSLVEAVSTRIQAAVVPEEWPHSAVERRCIIDQFYIHSNTQEHECNTGHYKTDISITQGHGSQTDFKMFLHWK